MESSYVNVPIVLSYDGGGMKLTEGEGNAGIGWNVFAGGQVSREVRGFPDDSNGNGPSGRKGWLYVNIDSVQNFSPVADNNLADCSDEWQDYNYLNSIRNANRDTEPDIFNISAPGLSGQFFFDHNKNIVFSPYQDLDVDYVIQNGTLAIFSFSITRNDGVKYLFTLQESYDMHAKPYNGNQSFELDAHPFKVSAAFFSAWKLTSIEMPDSKTITFSYNSANLSESKEYRRWLNKSTNKIDTLYAVTNLMTQYKLSSIKSDLDQASFSYIHNQQLISRVTVQRSMTAYLPNQGNKRFLFDYVQIRDSGDTEQENIGRKYFLKSLRETNDNCVSFPSYSFEYYNVDLVSGKTDMPIKNGFAQDYWGYYSGKPNDATSLIPALYYNTSAEGAERMRIRPNPNVAGYTQLSGVDRNTNAATVHYGSLKRITYPPGGFGEITYEPADYYDSLATTTYQGGGVRVAQVKMSDGDSNSSNDIVTTYEYKRSDNHSSGKLLYPPSFAWFHTDYDRSPDNMAPDATVYYSRVTVSQSGTGKTIYEYHIPGAYSKTTQGDWEAPFTRIARSSLAIGNCSVYSIYKNGYFIYPYASSTNFGFERGRLSKVLTYSQAGTLVKESSYNYLRIGPTPVYTYGMRLEKADANAWMYTKYKLLANTTKVTVTEVNKTYDPNSPSSFISNTLTYNYDPGHYLLKSTSFTNSDGSLFKTEFNYAKDFSVLTTPTDSYATAIKSLNDNFRHGVLIETIKKTTPPGGSESTIGAELTAYLTFPNAGGLVLPGETHIFNGTSGFNGSHVTGTSTFQIHAPYRKTLTVVDYDQYGNAMSLQDAQRNISSFLYAQKAKYAITGHGFFPLPRAVIKQARHDEVFHSFFDFVPITVGATTYQPQDYFGVATNPYSNQLAMSLPGAVALTKSGIQKSSNPKYRFTARVRNAAAITLTFKAVNGAATASKTINVAASGSEWVFIEDVLDISSVPSPFNFELQTSGAVDIDEVLFYPEHAVITTHTYNFFGKLSDTDSRGVSAFLEYDQNGKLIYLKDQDKNILQYNEYAYNRESEEALSADFTTSFAKSTASGVFRATPGCIEEATFTWFVNDAQLLTGINETVLNTNFTTAFPRVRLEVSAPGYIKAVREDTLTWQPPLPAYVPPTNTPCTPTATLSMAGSTTFDPCNNPSDSGTRSLSFVITSGQSCVQASYLEYMTNGTDGAAASQWTIYPGGISMWDYSAIPIGAQDVSIRGVVTYPGGTEVTDPVTLTYVNNPNCE
ncbi:MAG: hypothetical protein RH860_07995 [Cytophagales bacterium]